MVRGLYWLIAGILPDLSKKIAKEGTFVTVLWVFNRDLDSGFDQYKFQLGYRYFSRKNSSFLNLLMSGLETYPLLFYSYLSLIVLIWRDGRVSARADRNQIVLTTEMAAVLKEKRKDFPCAADSIASQSSGLYVVTALKRIGVLSVCPSIVIFRKSSSARVVRSSL